MKNDTTSITAAGISSQKLRLFMRANAMSAAPICSGTIQFAKPTKAGMIAPKTMISPCIVVNWLNSSGLKNCRPGWNSSARMPSASTPPTMNIVNENNRYIVPMSLWFVANSQRRQPCGCAVVVVVVMARVVAVVEHCTHGIPSEPSRRCRGHLRAATTSDGCTSCPVLLPQLFLVKVMTAASSVSDSCFHDGIAPLSGRCSTT